jgi:hypothetical protein
MTINDIITEFGAYYQKNGQNAARIFQGLRANTVTSELFTPVLTDETVWRAAQAVQKRILQPFQKAFTPIDGAEFKPVEIKQFKMKVDDEQYPDDLEATWLGFLAASGNNRTEWPFVRWYVEAILIPQLKEDEEVNEIFWGVRDEPTPNTPGDASTGMDGINKIIMDHITGGRITPITTGALAADPGDFLDQIEEFVDSINAKYYGANMTLNMSETNARKYRRGYNARYGVNTNALGKNSAEVAETNITIMGLPSMLGSNGIWCTPKPNAIKLMKRSENMNKIEIERVDRLVKFYTDFSEGVGFIIPEAVFVNELFDEQGS